MLWEWWERYRRLLLLVGAILFLGSSIWWYLADQAARSHEQTTAPFTPAAAAPAPAAGEAAAEPIPEKSVANAKSERETAAAPLFVDVKGKVKNPGLYRLETGMRVADAIEKAGGPLPEADLEQINLAQPLQDGSAIVIPAKRSSLGENGEAPPPAAVQPVLPAGMLGDQANARININTATKEELMKLPGIGEAKAQAILEHREKKRLFHSPEELKQISGIGDKVYERLKDHVRTQ